MDAIKIERENDELKVRTLGISQAIRDSPYEADICSRNGPPRIPDNYTCLVKRQMLSRIIGENFDLPRTQGICAGKREISKISRPAAV